LFKEVLSPERTMNAHLADAQMHAPIEPSQILRNAPII
jgi:hypothetical protein